MMVYIKRRSTISCPIVAVRPCERTERRTEGLGFRIACVPKVFVSHLGILKTADCAALHFKRSSQSTWIIQAWHLALLRCSMRPSLVSPPHHVTLRLNGLAKREVHWLHDIELSSARRDLSAYLVAGDLH